MDYAQLVSVYEQLEQTTKRLAYTVIISKFLKTVSENDLPQTMLLLEGRVFPRWDSRELGVASKIILKAINTASGQDQEKIQDEWKNTGDLGTVAANLLSKKKQATLTVQTLTLQKVFDNLQKIATMDGSGSVDRKIQLIAELLTSASPSEAKFIVRTILNDMRIGVGEGTLRDSIVWAYFGEQLSIEYNEEKNKIELEDREEFNKHVEIVQRAYDIANEFGPVAIAAREGIPALQKIEMQIGTPIKVMLALKVKTIAEAFERCEKPCAFEYKYDGMRMQLHKDNDHIKVYTRRLEDVTAQFPEVVDAMKEIPEQKLILDAEAVGYDKKTGNYLPFQNISQRIKRKYGIEEMAQKFPVEVNVFDIINHEGNNMLEEPFEKRRELIQKIIKEQPKKIKCAQSIVTESEQEATEFYDQALKSGNEGLMIKKLDAPYKPGSRVGFMVKLKPTKENFDLVIVKSEWGEGKRSSWLSSFTLACKDSDNNFLEIGKVSTGLKEKSEEGLSFENMTELLKPLITKENGKEVTVKPEIIIEVGFEEIQKSQTYASGYALRFPRVIQLREDRGIDDITTLDMVQDSFDEQVK